MTDSKSQLSPVADSSRLLPVFYLRFMCLRDPEHGTLLIRYWRSNDPQQLRPRAQLQLYFAPLKEGRIPIEMSQDLDQYSSLSLENGAFFESGLHPSAQQNASWKIQLPTTAQALPFFSGNSLSARFVRLAAGRDFAMQAHRFLAASGKVQILNRDIQLKMDISSANGFLLQLQSTRAPRALVAWGLRKGQLGAGLSWFPGIFHTEINDTAIFGEKNLEKTQWRLNLERPPFHLHWRSEPRAQLLIQSLGKWAGKFELETPTATALNSQISLAPVWEYRPIPPAELAAPSTQRQFPEFLDLTSPISG